MVTSGFTVVLLMMSFEAAELNEITKSQDHTELMTLKRKSSVTTI